MTWAHAIILEFAAVAVALGVVLAWNPPTPRRALYRILAMLVGMHLGALALVAWFASYRLGDQHLAARLRLAAVICLGVPAAAGLASWMSAALRGSDRR